MAVKRWLNIVVDGNIALEPYWLDIVSSYLEKIVRCFRGNTQEEEAYLGLVLYNANTELDAGYDIQFINWTKDENKYLETLSSLSFNGNDTNQYTMAEGLAEALVMYPKPSDIMTTREYYNAERHCILVAPGDPTPRRMMLCLPMIRKGHLVGQRLQASQVDFMDVAQMFAPLAVSLSVITPNSLPIFGAIFNLGNNVLTLANAPISSYSTGRFTVLLSRNFQKAHDALQENRIASTPSTRSAEPINTTPATALHIVHANNLQVDNDPSSTREVTIGETINEANSKTDSVSVSSQTLNYKEQILPNATNQTNVALASSSQSQMNVYDDIMAELSTGKDIFTQNKRQKTFITLEEDNLKDFFELQQLHFDDINNTHGQEQGGASINKNISMEALKAVELELEEALKDASHTTSKNQTSNVELTPISYKEVNIPPQEVQVHASSAGEGSSTGLLQSLRSSKGVLIPMSSSENSTNSASLVHQKNPSGMWSIEPQTWYHQRGMMKTTTRLGIVDPWDPSHAIENSLMQFQPNSSPSQISMFPDASSHCARGPVRNFSGHPMRQHFPGNQYQMNHVNAFGPLNMAPTSYPGQFLYPPSLDDFQDYVHTWEGSLVGKIHSNRLCVIKAKAFRKSTTPLTLTIQWASRLEFTHLVPQKAVNHTKTISSPIDYVFFHVLKFNNVDLYKHLKSKNLCAKFDLPFQSIILSPIEREQFFIGIVFPGNQCDHASGSQGQPKQHEVVNRKLKELRLEAKRRERKRETNHDIIPLSFSLIFKAFIWFGLVKLQVNHQVVFLRTLDWENVILAIEQYKYISFTRCEPMVDSF